MSRIGILTLYFGNHNYGGILQAYALQQALQLLGYDAKQISYILESGYPSSHYKVKKYGLFLKPWIRRMKFGADFSNREKKIDEFAARIPHTKTVAADTIRKTNEEFDTFICGSDQIWNPMGWQKELMLSFADKGKKKISYAASVARDQLTAEEAKYLWESIKDFNAISMREEASVQALSRYYPEAVKIKVMPDPTLLLKREEWVKISSSSRMQKPYIFGYFLGNQDGQKEEVIRYAEKKQLDVWFIGDMKLSHLQWEKEHSSHILHGIGVKEFLSLILNAQVVFTDSFHGAVFSSIFETPFFVFQRFAGGDKLSMNSRIDTLMKTLGIERSVHGAEEAEGRTAFTGEELGKIRENLALQREKGLRYLSQSIGDGKTANG